MWKKAVGGVFLLIVVVIGGGLLFLTLRQPAMAPASRIRVDRSPERVARGQYLFQVANCGVCHSELDETRFGFPVKPGGLGKGQIEKTPGLPGRIVPVNITSDEETGVGKMTDGELIRAIREGIGRDGRVLFPMMPYTEYRHMSDEDVESLVAFLRTLPAVRNVLPKTEVSFPVNLLVKSTPQPVGSVRGPDKSDKIAYGRYLARIGGCYFCHTPLKNNASDTTREFAGGHEFPLSTEVKVVSMNLTPHRETGTGDWTEKVFIEKFTQYKEYVEKGPPKIDLRDNTVMPWLGFAGSFSEEDLSRIYAFLRTVTPIENAVETKPSASEEARSKKK